MAKKPKLEKAKVKFTKVQFTLGIGLADERSETIEYDAGDIPDGREDREKWLNEEWRDWSANFIDGGASFVEE